jgi:archaemetzincin
LLEPLDKALPDPSPGEWLAQHEEPGQSFLKYAKIRPNVLTRQRNVLYIQPIGDLSDTEKKLVRMTAAYLKVYFACDVKTLDAINADTIPENARRKHPQWGDPQLLTSHILEKVLAPKLPSDAFATIAFTNQDLWPGDGWNFVFGYAMYRDRVGVWSLYRNGDPDESEEAFKKCLWRTVKLATHETGHMFSMRHCTHAACNMQGSNSLQESDLQPLRLCSQCHAKTVFATGCDPIKRLKALKSLCAEYGFEKEVKQYQAAIEKLTP